MWPRAIVQNRFKRMRLCLWEYQIPAATPVLQDRLSDLSKKEDEKLNNRLVDMSLTNPADLWRQKSSD